MSQILRRRVGFVVDGASIDACARRRALRWIGLESIDPARVSSVQSHEFISREPYAGWFTGPLMFQ